MCHLGYVHCSSNFIHITLMCKNLITRLWCSQSLLGIFWVLLEPNKNCVFLLAIQISETDITRASKILADFQKNEGAELQKLLVQENSANPNTSYIWDIWSDHYLNDRRWEVILLSVNTDKYFPTLFHQMKVINQSFLRIA